jgi:anaphase-promoting complex subunit 1
MQGHLKALGVTDLYDYLTQGHDPTTVGIFLGECR